MDREQAEQRMADARKRLDPLLHRLEAELSELGMGGFVVIQGDLIKQDPKPDKPGGIFAAAMERGLNMEVFGPDEHYDGASYDAAEAEGRTILSPQMVAAGYVLHNREVGETVLTLKAYDTLAQPAAILLAMTTDWPTVGEPGEHITGLVAQARRKIDAAINWLTEHNHPLPDVWAEMRGKQKKEGDSKPKGNAFSFEEVKDEQGNVVGFRGPDGDVLTFADHEQGDEHGRK